MRILTSIAVATIFSLGFYSIVFGAETAPKAKIANPEINFDKIEAGKTETKTVKIENVGGGKLEITKISSNSPSITPSMTEKVIEAGKSGEIQIKFDSTGIEPSILVKYVYVYTNDPELGDRAIPVTCRAIVVPVDSPLIQLIPFEVDLGVLNVGETVTRTIEFRNVGTANLEVEPIQYLDSQFKLTKNISTRTLPPGSTGSFEISFEAKSPNKIESYILIKSNTAGGPFSKVSIVGTVVDKNITIAGITPRLDKDGKPENPEKYNIKFSNYFAPYRLKVTVLNGPKKGTVIDIPENNVRSDIIEIDAGENGKTISLQVDIIIEPPKPVIEEKKPEEVENKSEESKPEGAEETKPADETKKESDEGKKE